MELSLSFLREDPNKLCFIELSEPEKNYGKGKPETLSYLLENIACFRFHQRKRGTQNSSFPTNPKQSKQVLKTNNFYRHFLNKNINANQKEHGNTNIFCKILSAHIHTHTHTQTHTHIYILYIYAFIYIFALIYICIYMHSYTFIYICLIQSQEMQSRNCS